jgi:hypothetical protein
MSGQEEWRGSNTEGFPIPERYKEQLGGFDTNNDGKLTSKEIDAMPDGLRTRSLQALQQRLGGGGE